MMIVLFNSVALAMPTDDYTDSQSGWIVVLFLMVMFVLAGFGTGHPIGFIFSVIVALAAIVLSCMVWNW